MMKNFVLSFLLILLLFNFSYNTSEACMSVNPNESKDCNNITSEYSGGYKEIACCFVTYSLDGNVKKCVPVMKTLNGLNMYITQIENMGGSSISVECSSSYLSISILLILMIIL